MANWPCHSETEKGMYICTCIRGICYIEINITHSYDVHRLVNNYVY
jgi:hypothetical protein